MALIAQNVTRVFKAKIGATNLILDDPNPDFSADEVLTFYSNSYPELTTSTVAGPVMNDDSAEYEFKTTIGTKG